MALRSRAERKELIAARVRRCVNECRSHALQTKIRLGGEKSFHEPSAPLAQVSNVLSSESITMASYEYKPSRPSDLVCFSPSPDKRNSTTSTNISDVSSSRDSVVSTKLPLPMRQRQTEPTGSESVQPVKSKPFTFGTPLPVQQQEPTIAPSTESELISAPTKENSLPSVDASASLAAKKAPPPVTPRRSKAVIPTPEYSSSTTEGNQEQRQVTSTAVTVSAPFLSQQAIISSSQKMVNSSTMDVSDVPSFDLSAVDERTGYEEDEPDVKKEPIYAVVSSRRTREEIDLTDLDHAAASLHANQMAYEATVPTPIKAAAKAHMEEEDIAASSRPSISTESVLSFTPNKPPRKIRRAETRVSSEIYSSIDDLGKISKAHDGQTPREAFNESVLTNRSVSYCAPSSTAKVENVFAAAFATPKAANVTRGQSKSLASVMELFSPRSAKKPSVSFAKTPTHTPKAAGPHAAAAFSTPSFDRVATIGSPFSTRPPMARMERDNIVTATTNSAEKDLARQSDVCNMYVWFF